MVPSSLSELSVVNRYLSRSVYYLQNQLDNIILIHITCASGRSISGHVFTPTNTSKNARNSVSDNELEPSWWRLRRYKTIPLRLAEMR